MFAISEKRKRYQRGAITVTYLFPYTSAPTAAQQAAALHSTVVATIASSAAADTQAIVTHNFNMATADITHGFPTPILTPQDNNEITSAWFEVSENPNYSVFGKGVLTASGTQKVTILRPTSLIK